MVPGLGFRDDVVLPRSSLKWVTSQPESVLSIYEGFRDLDQADYNLSSHKFITDPWNGNLVKTQMNRVLESLATAMNDELGAAFDQRLGTNTEQWREIEVKNTMKMVVGQASSRFTVGLPLC